MKKYFYILLTTCSISASHSYHLSSETIAGTLYSGSLPHGKYFSLFVPSYKNTNVAYIACDKKPFRATKLENKRGQLIAKVSLLSSLSLNVFSPSNGAFAERSWRGLQKRFIYSIESKPAVLRCHEEDAGMRCCLGITQRKYYLSNEWYNRQISGSVI